MKPNKLIFALLLLAFGQAVAQPFSLDPKIKPIEIKLTDYKKGDAKMSGKMGTATITQNADTLYYFVKGAGIYQTVMVAVGNNKPNQNIDVALCKDSWAKPNRTAKVGTKHYYEKFRTEGSFGIRIITKQRKSQYGIVVWISDEPKKIKMPNAFQVKTATKKQ